MENNIENKLSETMQNRIVIPVYDIMMLPDTSLVLDQAAENTMLGRLLEKGVGEFVAVSLRLKPTEAEIAEDDFHSLGVLVSLDGTMHSGDKLLAQADLGERVEVKNFELSGGLWRADYVLAPEEKDLDEKSEAELIEYCCKVIHETGKHFRGSDEYLKIADSFKRMNDLISYIAQPISAEEKYELLKENSEKERSLRFLDILIKQKESIELNLELNEKFSEKANAQYREQALRAQLKAIQEELKDSKSEDGRNDDYRTRIEKADLPEEIRRAALEEADKLDYQGQGGAEEGVIRNYLEFILKLPWKKEKAQELDLKKAREILNRDHYGLDKVKERILQHLAVIQLKKSGKGSILLLVGPPGTGKTSLGRSIAEAMGRKYVRISLGGIRDESEIRGHRRTYVGSMAGRILQSMKQAGTTNPVMVLDEVDKLMSGGFNGDPASALLEVLDPEQNNTFTDHYLDLPYDLSDVFFIATANSLDTVPAPLLDRMEVIEISGYTTDEKMHIAREHLLPDVMNDHGLNENELVIPDETIRSIIEDYTLESGVRGLKKQLAAIARVASEKVVTHEGELPVKVRPEDLEELLGRRVSHHDRAQLDNPPGVVTGLAWTPVGGEILFIEATDMPGTGEITLTGQLGDVMKESARISLSLLKSRLPLDSADFKSRDIHIHVPSGATPKDGPSAGIALMTALASLFTGRKVDPRLAMTGEITLRGAVLPIGGLREKLLGAQRAGITKVLIPKENEIDLKDVPEDVFKQIKIITVETAEDVLREALDLSLPRLEHILLTSIPDSHSVGTAS
jgi:ATP-dependent Lon protease